MLRRNEMVKAKVPTTPGEILSKEFLEPMDLTSSNNPASAHSSTSADGPDHADQTR